MPPKKGFNRKKETKPRKHRSRHRGKGKNNLSWEYKEVRKEVDRKEMNYVLKNDPKYRPRPIGITDVAWLIHKDHAFNYRLSKKLLHKATEAEMRIDDYVTCAEDWKECEYIWFHPTKKQMVMMSPEATKKEEERLYQLMLKDMKVRYTKERKEKEFDRLFWLMTEYWEHWDLIKWREVKTYCGCGSGYN